MSLTLNDLQHHSNYVTEETGGNILELAGGGYLYGLTYTIFNGASAGVLVVDVYDDTGSSNWIFSFGLDSAASKTETRQLVFNPPLKLNAGLYLDFTTETGTGLVMVTYRK